MNKSNFIFENKPELLIDDFSIKLRKNSDFWRMHLDYCKIGMNNELGVYSHQQKTPDVAVKENETVITYPSLIAEDGSIHNIKLILKILQKDGALYFSADMDNGSETRINELQYPLFEFERINGDCENDELVVPRGLGQKIVNPHDYAQKYHTEYMAADYKNVWRMFRCPDPMSMPWIGVESGDKYLYMGWHSKEWRQCSFSIGTEPRGADEKYIIYSISSYPAVTPGERIVYDGFVLAGFDGDWRCGCDFYRAWADETWHHPVKKEGIKHITGWQRIIMKHQYGEVFHKYSDLVQIYKDGAEYGINMLLLFAWWKGGMDNGYPNYEPDPDLGGAEMLKQAIKEINSMGGIVILYANGHIIDVSTDYYKTEGKNYTVKDIEKNEYREFYKFSNNGTLLKYGHKTFATGCYGTKQWPQKLMEIEKGHLSLGSNGTFFDQIATLFNFCFDDSHSHGKRIDLAPQLRLNGVKEMKKLLNENEYFGTEVTVDRIAEEVDFVHGCGFGQIFSDDAYPYIFRYTFPGAIISNRMIHDEKEGWERHLNYAFTFGLIFDVAIYRCRVGTIKLAPEYAKHIKKMIEMRKPYFKFFKEGTFNLPSIPLPSNVKAAEYQYGDKRIMTVWNDSDDAVEVCGKTVPAQGIDIIEMDK